MNKKKANIHYHYCACGRWQHEGQCNLSKHAKCGQKVAHDYSYCIKGKKLFLHPVKNIDTLIADRIEKKITQRTFLSETLALHSNKDDSMAKLHKARMEKRYLTKNKKRAKVKNGKI